MTAHDELDERLRKHFEHHASVHAVPDVATMLAAAEFAARAPRNHRRWALVVGALAASLALAVALQLRPNPDAPLIAELSATTYWTGPSDRWPVTRSADYLGLPRFDEMNTELDEVQTWF